MYNEQIKKIFAIAGIKNTSQRHVLYSFLLERTEPISADDIYQGLSKNDDCQINLSTVYRILETFTKKGIVVKSNFTTEGKSTYEIKHSEHRHHMICVACNKITPITGCPLKQYEEILKETTGYKIIEHRLEILGICPSCQEKSKDDI